MQRRLVGTAPTLSLLSDIYRGLRPGSGLADSADAHAAIARESALFRSLLRKPSLRQQFDNLGPGSARARRLGTADHRRIELRLRVSFRVRAMGRDQHDCQAEEFPTRDRLGIGWCGVHHVTAHGWIMTRMLRLRLKRRKRVARGLAAKEPDKAQQQICQDNDAQ